MKPPGKQGGSCRSVESCCRPSCVLSRGFTPFCPGCLNIGRCTFSNFCIKLLKVVCQTLLTFVVPKIASQNPLWDHFWPLFLPELSKVPPDTCSHGPSMPTVHAVLAYTHACWDRGAYKRCQGVPGMVPAPPRTGKEGGGPMHFL